MELSMLQPFKTSWKQIISCSQAPFQVVVAIVVQESTSRDLMPPEKLRLLSHEGALSGRHRPAAVMKPKLESL